MTGEPYTSSGGEAATPDGLAALRHDLERLMDVANHYLRDAEALREQSERYEAALRRCAESSCKDTAKVAADALSRRAGGG